MLANWFQSSLSEVGGPNNQHDFEVKQTLRQITDTIKCQESTDKIKLPLGTTVCLLW